MEAADAKAKLPSRWAGVSAKLPLSLEQFRGPPAGVVELPVDLAWSGDRSFDLADPAQRYLYHMTVLTAAVTREHYAHWLNADLLRAAGARCGSQGRCVPYGMSASPNLRLCSVLDGDHARLVQAVLPVCAEYGLALAGGYAIKAHGLVDRPSDDIDFATAANAPVEEIIVALADAYREAGYEVAVLDIDPRKGHLLVTFPLGGTYRVDLLKEALNHPLVMMEFGPVIGLADAVALKMSALHDRVMPRDLLDIHGATPIPRSSATVPVRGRSMRSGRGRSGGPQRSG